MTTSARAKALYRAARYARFDLDSRKEKSAVERSTQDFLMTQGFERYDAAARAHKIVAAIESELVTK